MRLNSIELSWFRGSADSVKLELCSRSAVVYGANGSGKSTFVDAIEYVIAGKVKHLSNEYSGKRQERALLNTHMPKGVQSKVVLAFDDRSVVDIVIDSNGTCGTTADCKALLEQLHNWKLEKVVIRQDEIENFIKKTKGEKYQDVVPLIGLEEYEQAANNIHRLMVAVQAKSAIAQKGEKLKADQQALFLRFKSSDEAAILGKLRELSKKYGEAEGRTIEELAKFIIEEADKRIETLTPEITRRTLAQGILGLKPLDKLQKMNALDSGLVTELDPLINKRIDVLAKAKAYALRLEADTQTKCPACGREMAGDQLKQFVNTELDLLTRERACLESAKQARRTLFSAMRDLLQKIEDPSMAAWLQDEKQRILLQTITELKGRDFSDPDEGLNRDTNSKLLLWLPIVESHFSAYIEAKPIDVKELVDDKNTANLALNQLALSALQKEVEGINCILSALEECEEAIRSEINTRTNIIVNTISSRIQQYWSEIHPNEPIESVKLYASDDKSMDIGLKFFGKEQPTPRLTLSEGHRNSLGLCVFLAMASLDDPEDKPIIMDDIVSSLDREHRAALADLFMKHLSNRQLIILTHDSEWFRELKDRLPENQYRFMKLKPWRIPEEGVCVLESKTDFNEARALLNVDSNCAANRARAIMDYRLSKACENLRLQMVYKIGDHNDHRTCYDFMTRILADSKTHLAVFDEHANEVTTRRDEIISDWSKALTLLKAWGNRASHSGSATAVESEKLIDVCEKACNDFRCPSCGKNIWAFADPSSLTPKKFRCECGNLTWKN